MSSNSQPPPQPREPRGRDGNRDHDDSDELDELDELVRPGHVTARAGAVLIGLALGLLLIGWVLYGLIDVQRG